MNEEAIRLSIRDRIKWWIYEKCFAYCIRSVHPDADPSDFCFLDMANFIAVSKDETAEIIEEAPDLAWRFESLLQQHHGRSGA